MLPLRRRLLLEAAKLLDTLGMIVAFALATAVVAYQIPEISFQQFLSMRVKLENFALFGGFLIAWRLIFTAFGLYETRRLSARAREVLDALKATTVAAGMLFLCAWVLRIRMVTPVFIGCFWLVSTAGAMSIRLLGRYVLQRVRRRGRNLRQMLVVGTNARAVGFARRIEAHRELGYTLAGFVDDAWVGRGQFARNGHKLVSGLDGFLPYLRTHVVDEVVIALPMESAYVRARCIARDCAEQGIAVRLLPDVFDMRLAGAHAAEFEGEAVLTLSTSVADSWQVLLKRSLDIVLSLAVIALVAPLYVLAAVAIKLTSPGPVFFIQERVGLNKRIFRMFKFRTMVQDAEQRQDELESRNEAAGAVFKIRNDPRITPVGSFLRKTSIDELPQLLNVLKGDMSLVGPRPLPVRDYKGFEQDWQLRRFSVRPGITCLWQINGRSSIPFEKWMQLDMEYIDRWSLGLDLKILAMTIPAVVRGVGAA
jgi:exopolysaccharide biosynthesis polyprenyl glycosylphosphotransferase